MKNLCIVVIFILGVGISASGPNTAINCTIVEKCKTVQNNVSIDTTMQIADSVLIQYMTIKQFKDSLGKYESWNTYNIVNKYGMMGKYQFSPYMRVRFARVGPKTFLFNPQIQERAMNSAISYYIEYIYKYGYNKYINTEIDGVTVTMESLLLGVHFSPLYLMWWLESNGQLNPRDANITIKDYMEKFQNKGVEQHYKILTCQK